MFVTEKRRPWLAWLTLSRYALIFALKAMHSSDQTQALPTALHFGIVHKKVKRVSSINFGRRAPGQAIRLEGASGLPASGGRAEKPWSGGALADHGKHAP